MPSFMDSPLNSPPLRRQPGLFNAPAAPQPPTSMNTLPAVAQMQPPAPKPGPMQSPPNPGATGDPAGVGLSPFAPPAPSPGGGAGVPAPVSPPSPYAYVGPTMNLVSDQQARGLSSPGAPAAPPTSLLNGIFGGPGAQGFMKNLMLSDPNQSGFAAPMY